VLLAVAGGVAGVGPMLLATAQPAWAFMSPVDIRSRAFYSNDGATPALTRIDVGDKVLWRNTTDEAHSVTFDTPVRWSEDVLGRQNSTAEHRFEEDGTYRYHCKFHKGMTGTVEVVDPNAPPPPTTATTAPPSTTTTTAPATTTTEPPTTTTTAAPVTTTSAPRPPAQVPAPPVPNSAAAPPPTLATSSTTTAPPTTTSTAAPSTTVPPASPTTGDQSAPPGTSASAPPTTEAPRTGDTRDDVQTAAGRPASAEGGLDMGAAVLVALLIAVGLFGAWTLFRVRPGRI
jgi:plastocyanin